MKNIKTEYTEVINFEKHGKELYFKAIPTYQERTILKANGYRWHNQKKCWYISDKKVTTQKTEIKAEAQNELGIKVGDIFYMSWGYEQTNVDFFQVVALKGKTQVVIKEVHLTSKKEEYAVSGMSRDVAYNTTDTKIIENSVFVKDQDKGMIKKVCGNKENPYLNMTSYANAYKYEGQKLYESWYY